MTLDDICLMLYRYILSRSQRGNDLSAVCRAIGHGRIEIAIRDGKPVAVNVFVNLIKDEEMERKTAELAATAGTAKGVA